MNERTTTRRSLLRSLAILGGLSVVALGGALAIPSSRSKLAWAWQRLIELPLSPASRIACHFDYLTLDRDGLARFVADWEEHVAPLSRSSSLPPEIYTRFLLSTDFFPNGADESRLVRYRGFADPYVTSCYNPLATFDE